MERLAICGHAYGGLADSPERGVSLWIPKGLDGEIGNPQIWSSALSAADIANLYLHQLNDIAWP